MKKIEKNLTNYSNRIIIFKEVMSKNDIMDRIEGFSLNTFNVKDIDRVDISKYGFVTEQSKDFNHNLIREADRTIKRYETIAKLNNILMNHEMSEEIEKGLFESAIAHVTTNNLLNKFVQAIYLDKLDQIISNISDKNHLNNHTLKKSLQTGLIKPIMVAFLPPEKLHPENWKAIIEKKNRRDYVENNLATTDVYKCGKCGESKMKVTELQTRGADEPSTKFVCCTICYNTFRIN